MASAVRFTRADPEARRRALVEAAELCLARLGRDGTTVRGVAARAGVSPGLIRHYFGSMDSLIAETYRSVGARVMAEVQCRLEAAGPDPERRLKAMIEANFRPPILDPDLLSTWLSFWSLVRRDPAIREIHGVVYADYRRQLEALIRSAATARGLELDARLAALGLSALLDGLWLEICLDPSAFTPGEAVAIAWRWVEALLRP